jgi:uncharacterized protein YjdB
MKKIFMLATAALIVFGGCKDDEEPVVAVTGVTISPSTVQTLDVGSTVALTATVAPDNATNKAVKWSSSSPGIASVTDGTVTAKTEGAATITVTTDDGGHTAFVGVMVNAAPAFAVIAEPINFTSVAGNSDITVTGNVAWTAEVNTDAAAWCSVSPGTGNGNGTVSVTVTANTDAERTATITISATNSDLGLTPVTVNVTQAAFVPILSATPTEIPFTYAAGEAEITVTANVAWTAESNADWLTLDPTSGDGNGTASVTVAANTDAERSATITISATNSGLNLTPVTVAVTQAPSLAHNTPANAASTQIWALAERTWSDRIQITSCTGGAVDETNITTAQCQSTMDGDVLRFYYNWQYVQDNAATLCPSPWKVPAKDDFDALVAAVTKENLTAAWGFGGHTQEEGNGIANAASQLLLWSSANWGDVALLINEGGYQVIENWGVKKLGMQVRCVNE